MLVCIWEGCAWSEIYNIPISFKTSRVLNVFFLGLLIMAVMNKFQNVEIFSQPIHVELAQTHGGSSGQQLILHFLDIKFSYCL